MAIDGGLRKTLAVGTRLVATYKKQEHTARVEQGEDGKLRFRLADGREFKSPSAAGSAAMSGIACNGWRFWSLVDDTTTPRGTPSRPAPQQAEKATAQARPTCTCCGKSFVGASQLAHHEANADRLCLAE